jgi:hypothetical protein
MALVDDAFWDELGVSWRASMPDAGLISSRLEARLRLQSALVSGGTVVGSVVSFFGVALAAWALWIGWSSHVWNFLTRGVTLAAVSVLAIIATLALHARNGMAARSLREMLQASIARTERPIRAADLACYAVVILAVGGTIGYALRIRLGRPPAVPMAEDLLVLVVAGLVLVWYRRSQTHALKKYRHLSQAFDSEDQPQ